MFVEVPLYVADGGYVTTVIVPKYNPMPDVLVWGARTFVRSADGRYLEAFVTHAWTLEEMRSFGMDVPPESIGRI